MVGRALSSSDILVERDFAMILVQVMINTNALLIQLDLQTQNYG